eukprot:scaffold5192_cov63-Phaeocystis_antarctica.AAC.3
MPTLGLTVGTRFLIAFIRGKGSILPQIRACSATGYSLSPRPERAASESLTYQSKGKRASKRPAWRVTRWRGQNAIVRRAAPTKRPRAEKRVVQRAT